MNHHYRDIRDRIDEEPRWWDEYAVPRYCEFSPDESANIYAVEVVLAEIECQNCGERFRVAFSAGAYERDTQGQWRVSRDSLKRRIEDSTLHYGDPPHSGCCAAGASMNSRPLRVLEYWREKEDGWGFERVLGLEVAIDAGW